MKTKCLILFFTTLALANEAKAQNLLNKLKKEAVKEASKIAAPQSQTQSAANKNKLSANVTRTVAVTLGNDEIFDYSENCIDLGASMSQVSFIVTKGNGSTAQCYSYKNGSRTPVPCPTSTTACNSSLQCSYYKLTSIQLESDDAKKYIVNQMEEHKVAQPTLTDEQLKTMSAYMTKEQMDAVKKQMAEAQKQTTNQTYSTITSSSIKFNGKSYGPYKQVSQFYLTPDNKNFYAVVQEAIQTPGMNSFRLITSASTTTLAAPGLMPPIGCIASPDNSEFAMTVLTNEGKYEIRTSSGKTYPITDFGWYVGSWYSATGNHLIMIVKSQLYLDGQVIKTLDSNTSYDPCNIYVGSDSKNVTIVKDNTLSFADGDYFEFPLKIAIVNSAGKTYFKWMALENRDVVIYQKPY